MPEKSIREMSEWERRHYSLAAHIFHSTVRCCIILGLIATIIGLGLYTYALSSRYVSDSYNLSRNAQAILDKTVDVGPLVDEVMDRYHGLSDEIKADPYSEEYQAVFADITEREDYQTVISVLRDFLDSSDVEYIYLGMYDLEDEVLIYIADPDDTDTACPPGTWESTKRKGVKKFLNWDGSGTLYDIAHTKTYGWLCTSGYPFLDDDGNKKAFVLTDVSLANVRHGMKEFVIQYSLMIVVLTVVVAVLQTRHMKKALVKPINEVAGAAESYLDDRQHGVIKTDHFSNLNIKTGDEIENLSLLLADMEKSLGLYSEQLKTVTAEKERIATELSLATRIQADMLPNIYPAFPDRSEFDIYASMKPAREVGGDFYDYFLIDDDHLGMVMADVSGKGIPAALFMMASKIIIGNNAMLGKSPAEILEYTNSLICANNREEMFVTVWIGILTISSGKIIASNAGHEYPVLMGKDGKFKTIKDSHGFVVGGFEESTYQNYSMQLEPGSKLFLYTDGVPEATNEADEMFGMDRLIKVLNDAVDGSPETVLSKVSDSVTKFVGNSDQFDDLTMLCMEYKGPVSGSEDGSGK